jgi:general secretion pathway protein A
VPRLVNLLCDRSLLAGYAAGMREIGPEFVSQAAREILGARRRRRLARRSLWRSGAAAAVLLAALAAGALAWRQLSVPPAETSPAAVSAGPATLGATAPGDVEEAG